MEQRAAEMAFVQVAAGAFQMPAHHVIAPLVEEEEEEEGGRTESLTTGGGGGGGRDTRSETIESPRKIAGAHPNGDQCSGSYGSRG